MKVMRYNFKGIPIEIDWNEVNEEIAKKEADNGKYEIVDVENSEINQISRG